MIHARAYTGNSYLVFIRHAASDGAVLSRRVLVCSTRLSRARLIVLNRATEIEKQKNTMCFFRSIIEYVRQHIMSVLSMSYIIRRQLFAV